MMEDRPEACDELVQEFYGINSATFKVDSVAITHSGKLSQWTDRGYQIHQIQGSDVLTEIRTLTSLIELVNLHPQVSNHKRHKILADLTKKALNMLENRSEEHAAWSQ
jgi:hypothetical protein